MIIMKYGVYARKIRKGVSVRQHQVFCRGLRGATVWAVTCYGSIASILSEHRLTKAAFYPSMFQSNHRVLEPP